MAARSRPSWDPASQDEYFDLNYQETAERRPRAVSGPPPPPAAPVNDPEYALRTVFGFPSFRTRQLDIVRTALSGKDVFVIMPTGGGKSLCFQVPAVLTRGVTVVISPLLSLIQDQVLALLHSYPKGVPTTYLSSDQSEAQARETYRELHKPIPSVKLLYVTPERVSCGGLEEVFGKLYATGNLARFVIDEAHCVSAWGHDFRKDYLKLGFLRSRYPAVPIMALTATATVSVKADVMSILRMRPDTAVFEQDFNRPNLRYAICQKPSKAVDALEMLLEYILTNHGADAIGIVYCFSRDECEFVANWLESEGLKADYYHAGMTPAQRLSVQTLWQLGRVKVVCATIAYGMGVDNPNVRYVVHFVVPKCMEGYYQESGRAGRDGGPADCILMFSHTDVGRLRRMVNKKQKGMTRDRRQVNLTKLDEIAQFCQAKTCRRAALINYFGGSVSFDPRRCAGTCDACGLRFPSPLVAVETAEEQKKARAKAKANGSVPTASVPGRGALSRGSKLTGKAVPAPVVRRGGGGDGDIHTVGPASRPLPTFMKASAPYGALSNHFAADSGGDWDPMDRFTPRSAVAPVMNPYRGMNIIRPVTGTGLGRPSSVGKGAPQASVPTSSGRNMGEWISAKRSTGEGEGIGSDGFGWRGSVPTERVEEDESAWEFQRAEEEVPDDEYSGWETVHPPAPAPAPAPTFRLSSSIRKVTKWEFNDEDPFASNARKPGSTAPSLPVSAPTTSLPTPNNGARTPSTHVPPDLPRQVPHPTARASSQQQAVKTSTTVATVPAQHVRPASTCIPRQVVQGDTDFDIDGGGDAHVGEPDDDELADWFRTTTANPRPAVASKQTPSRFDNNLLHSAKPPASSVPEVFDDSVHFESESAAVALSANEPLSSLPLRSPSTPTQVVTAAQHQKTKHPHPRAAFPPEHVNHPLHVAQSTSRTAQPPNASPHDPRTVQPTPTTGVALKARSPHEGAHTPRAAPPAIPALVYDGGGTRIPKPMEEPLRKRPGPSRDEGEAVFVPLSSPPQQATLPLSAALAGGGNVPKKSKASPGTPVTYLVSPPPAPASRKTPLAVEPVGNGKKKKAAPTPVSAGAIERFLVRVPPPAPAPAPSTKPTSTASLKRRTFDIDSDEDA